MIFFRTHFDFPSHPDIPSVNMTIHPYKIDNYLDHPEHNPDDFANKNYDHSWDYRDHLDIQNDSFNNLSNHSLGQYKLSLNP